MLNVFYGFFLPLSRQSLLASSINSVLSCLLFFLAIFLPLRAQIGLVAVGISSELLLKLVGVMIVKFVEATGKRTRKGAHTPESMSIKDGTSPGSVTTESEDSKAADHEKNTSAIGMLVEATKKNVRIPGEQCFGVLMLKFQPLVCCP